MYWVPLELNESSFWKPQEGIWASPCVIPCARTSSNEYRNCSLDIPLKNKQLPQTNHYSKSVHLPQKFQKHSNLMPVLISIKNVMTIYGILKWLTRRRAQFPHFIAGESEGYRGEVTCWRWHHMVSNTILWGNTPFPERPGKTSLIILCLVEAGSTDHLLGPSPGIPHAQAPLSPAGFQVRHGLPQCICPASTCPSEDKCRAFFMWEISTSHHNREATGDWSNEPKIILKLPVFLTFVYGPQGTV